MKKDIPPNERSLSRKEMLERHRRREYQDAKNELNEFSRRALSGLQYHPEEEPLEATLNRLDRRTAPAGGRNFTIRHLLSIAAAAAVLLAAGYFVFFQPPGNEALFAEHFDYLPSAVNSRGEGQNTPSAYEEGPGLRTKALKAYEAGQYELAQSLMEKHLAENSRDAEVRLYLGILLLGEGKAEPAAGHLEATLNNLPKPTYERPAKWYLALAMLRKGETEQAKALFLELENGRDRYAMSSRAVLKQL